MFKGHGSGEINEIANSIMSCRRKMAKESKEFKEPHIIAYVGHEQYRALMRIEPGDVNSIKNKTFLGAKIVEVIEDSYLHITAR